MKALCMRQPGHISVEEQAEPICKPGEALIKILRCGICGSDISAFHGNNPTVKYPIIGVGHEGIGIVEQVNCDNSCLKPGDHVAIEPYVPCGNCYICKTGGNNCPDLHVAGVHSPGVMCEYVCFPVSLLHPLPQDLDLDVAALAEPITIGLHALDRVAIRQGETVVITGAGPIGLLTAFSAKARGALPILVDVLQERLDTANKYGIPNTCNSRTENLREYLLEHTGGILPDAMVECTGAVPVLGSMHEYVRNGGRIALVGWPKAPVTINTIRCQQKELTICPSRNSCHNFPEAIRLIASGAIPARDLISKVIAIDEINETLQDMIAHPEQYIKVVVRM